MTGGIDPVVILFILSKAVFQALRELLKIVRLVPLLVKGTYTVL